MASRLKPVTRKLVNIILSWICLHKEVQLRKSLDKAESIDSRSGEHLVSRQRDTGHSQISKSDTSQLIDLHSPLQIYRASGSKFKYLLIKTDWKRIFTVYMDYNDSELNGGRNNLFNADSID